MAGQICFIGNLSLKVPIPGTLQISGQVLFHSLSQGGDVSGQVVQLVRAEVSLEPDNLGMHLRQLLLRIVCAGA